MQMINFRNVFLFLFAAVAASSKAQNKPPQLGRNPVSEIVKAMTVEEKASLVVGTGLRMAGGNSPIIGGRLTRYKRVIVTIVPSQ